jgi:uncharacterized DUF497 family protein
LRLRGKSEKTPRFKAIQVDSSRFNSIEVRAGGQAVDQARLLALRMERLPVAAGRDAARLARFRGDFRNMLQANCSANYRGQVIFGRFCCAVLKSDVDNQVRAHMVSDVRFTWDTKKEQDNIASHGVDFTEAQQAFADPRAIVVFDPAHGGKTELRWWLLGKVGARVMLVRYTHRTPGIIRIIGAGYWRKGKDYYENYWKTRSN